MIVLKNISRIYGKKNQTSEVVYALNDVSLSLPESGFISICGASGSGKTTLLNIIGGLDTATSGEMIVDGISTKEFKDKDWDAYRNEKIGFVLQNCYLLPHLSIKDNVALKLQISNRKFDDIDVLVNHALKEVDLTDRGKDKPKTFSGGQKQRVAIARAIVGKPTVVLADEPTGALDSKNGHQIMEILKRLSKDHLVVMVTHNKEYASEFSDRIIELSDGKIIHDSLTVKEEKKVEEPRKQNTSFHLLTGEDKTGLYIQDLKKPLGGYKDKSLVKEEDKKWLEDYIKKNEELASKKKEEPKPLSTVSVPVSTSLKWGIKNLFLRIASTIAIVVATSLGLAGVGLILSISKGVEATFVETEEKALAQYPVNITSYSTYTSDGQAPSYTEFPSEQVIYADLGSFLIRDHKNYMSDRFLNYMNKMPKDYYTIKYETSSLLFYTLTNVVDKTDEYTLVYSPSNYFYKGLDLESFTKHNYDKLSGEYPSGTNDLAIVIDKYNRVDASILNFFGYDIDTSYQHEVKINFNEVVGKEFKLVENNQIYTYNSSTGLFDTINVRSASKEKVKEIYDSSKTTLRITGVLREKRDSDNPALNTGIVFSEKLANQVVEQANNSEILKAQRKEGKNKNVRTGLPITETKSGNYTYSADYNYENILYNLSGVEEKQQIQYFTNTFEKRNAIQTYFNNYKEDKSVDFTTLQFYDYLQKVSFQFDGALSLMTSVLYAFAFISVFVSMVLNAILTYISVHQRTNEIGLLRSLGARKKDIGVMIETESIICGLLGALLSIAFCCVFIEPINVMLTGAIYRYKFYLLSQTTFTLPGFQWWVAPIMIGIGILTAGLSALVPAIIAAKKDPAHAINE